MTVYQIKKLIKTTLLVIVTINAFSNQILSKDIQMFYPEPDPPVAKHHTTNVTSLSNENFQRSPNKEWKFHKTGDNKHPNGIEQQMVWLANRARANPSQEGIWLATTDDNRIALPRRYFNVDVQILQDEFHAYSPMPPAAFDVRLYRAAKVHSDDLISRDAQDHTGQLERIKNEGFSYSSYRGIVFAYADDAVNAHAGFNIDWGGGTSDGMQAGRGHRKAIMSLGGNYSNVGYASVEESNPSTGVGPFVITGNYCKAASKQDHFNRFIVGTVWEDLDENNMYDPGEGKGNITVMPDNGEYYAITSDSGGYAIPVTTGTYEILFSGNDLADMSFFVTVQDKSILLDYKVDNIGVIGDINNNSKIELADLIIGLRIISGNTPVSGVNLDADVDGDSRIGMEEILYLLKIIGYNDF
jgi:hypothetical protein